MTTSAIAHPPATLEGWYALHQIFRIDRGRVQPRELDRMIKAATLKLGGAPARFSTSKRKAGSGKREAGSGAGSAPGGSCFVSLIGSTSDLMVIHFRDTLDGIAVAQGILAQTTLARSLDPVYAFLSVTEAGLYHITAELGREAEARGGKVGDESYLQSLSDRSESERASAHVMRRLYPE